MKSHVITANGLKKVFHDFWHRNRVEAVAGIDFEVRPGEVFGLLGPNGSGKSTVLKLILGLLHPTSGSVSVMNKPPSSVAVRRRIGYLPEESQLYQHLTAVETLSFYGRLFGMSGSAIKSRTDELLSMVGLTDAAHRPVGQYSKGMARRIGLAQALLNDPDLLILDEPTAGLDPLGCRQIKDLLKQQALRGKTVLVSSHLLADMEDICHRIMLLHNGHSLAYGSMAELLTVPDRTVCFTVEGASENQVEQISSKIRKIVGARPAVDNPRNSLEEFFVKTVGKAGTARVEKRA
jgi:ABC-2 type transport system ATP-binding protein